MNKLVTWERICLVGHIGSMAFGLAGLLLVVPNLDFIVSLSPLGQKAFELSMANGGVVYILLGAIAVAIYAYRMLGIRSWLSFMLPAIFVSLGGELLGTSTGFPFGRYEYLNGLGYKIAGLVPFTIPLSWFYLGFVSYTIARAGLDAIAKPGKSLFTPIRHIGAIALGALLLTSWDFVLDPAMSQTAIPFWQWLQPGAFFGMPYQNFAGWIATGIIFMSIAAVLWPKEPIRLDRAGLSVLLAIYISNFVFSATMSLAAGLWIPVLLGIAVGMAPAAILWWMAVLAPNEDRLNPDTDNSPDALTPKAVAISTK